MFILSSHPSFLLSSFLPFFSPSPFPSFPSLFPTYSASFSVPGTVLRAGDIVIRCSHREVRQVIPKECDYHYDREVEILLLHVDRAFAISRLTSFSTLYRKLLSPSLDCSPRGSHLLWCPQHSMSGTWEPNKN